MDSQVGRSTDPAIQSHKFTDRVSRFSGVASLLRGQSDLDREGVRVMLKLEKHTGGPDPPGYATDLV